MWGELTLIVTAWELSLVTGLRRNFRTIKVRPSQVLRPSRSGYSVQVTSIWTSSEARMTHHCNRFAPGNGADSIHAKEHNSQTHLCSILENDQPDCNYCRDNKDCGKANV
jgi:hypothetical protein